MCVYVGTVTTVTWPAGWVLAPWVPQDVLDHVLKEEEERENEGEGEGGDSEDDGDEDEQEDEMPVKRARMDECCTR